MSTFFVNSPSLEHNNKLKVHLELLVAETVVVVTHLLQLLHVSALRVDALLQCWDKMLPGTFKTKVMTIKHLMKVETTTLPLMKVH